MLVNKAKNVYMKCFAYIVFTNLFVLVTIPVCLFAHDLEYVRERLVHDYLMLSACFPFAVWFVAVFAVVDQVWAVVGLDYSLRRFADRFPRFDHLCPDLFYRLYYLGFDRFDLA